jgi:hypothetical protein
MGNLKTINEQNQKQVKSGLHNSMSFKCNGGLVDVFGSNGQVIERLTVSEFLARG